MPNIILPTEQQMSNFQYQNFWMSFTRKIYQHGWSSHQVSNYKMRLKPGLTQEEFLDNMNEWFVLLGKWNRTLNDNMSIVEDKDYLRKMAYLLSQWLERVM